MQPLPTESAITLGEDGIYRWQGSTDLKRNPTTLYTILKGLGFSLAAVAVVMLIVLAGDSGINRSGLWVVAAISCGVIMAVLALTVLIYVIYANVMGGTYNASYFMDETGVLFVPGEKEAAVTRFAGIAAAASGAATGHFGITIAGLAAGEGTALSRFNKVRRVKGIRKHGVIKVSELMLFNQVYVAPQDYDFVFSYICEHCPKASIAEAN